MKIVDQLLEGNVYTKLRLFTWWCLVLCAFSVNAQTGKKEKVDIIVAGGTVLTMDEERIVAEAQRVGRLAWRRLFDSRPDLEVPGGWARC